MRELPQPSTTNSVTAFLIDEPVTYSVVQAEGSSVFANHRLKSLWNLHTTNLWMTATNLVNGIYTQGTCEYADNGDHPDANRPAERLAQRLQLALGRHELLDHGRRAPIAAPGGWKPPSRPMSPGAQPPIFTQADFAKKVAVTYATAMPMINQLRASRAKSPTKPSRWRCSRC